MGKINIFFQLHPIKKHKIRIFNNLKIQYQIRSKL